MNNRSKTKIVIICGPTASGKSALAIRVARAFRGEIISADSRQVYRGLNLGTGKVTKKEMMNIPHHLLDVADPRRRYNAARYVREARRAIEAVARRGRLPIITGGTGFYISALLGEENIADVPPDEKLRKELAGKTADELFVMLKKLDSVRAKTVDRRNPRRLIRAIEIAANAERNRNDTEPARKDKEKVNRPALKVLKIGIRPPREELRRRIRARLAARMRRGMIAEAKRLHASGLSWKRMDELGLEYRYLARYLRGQITKEEMIKKLETEICHYARRQMTWFRRDKTIKWFKPTSVAKIKTLVRKFLKRELAP